MLKTTSTGAAYYNKGVSRLKMGDFAEAVAQLRTAAKPYCVGVFSTGAADGAANYYH